MRGVGARAELKHRPKERPQPAGALHHAHRFEGSPHRFGVGVIRIVDDGHPITAVPHLHPVPADRAGRSEGGRGAFERHTDLEGDCERGEGVADLMATDEGKRHRGGAHGSCHLE